MSESIEQRGRGFCLANNILLLIVLMGLVSAEAYWLFRPGQTVELDETKLMEAVTARLEGNSEQIEAEAKRLAAELLPVLVRAIYRHSRENREHYLQALRQEGRVFTGNVQELLVVKVQEQYGDYFDRHRQVLVGEFPEAADRKRLDRILGDLREMVRRLSERYYLAEFARESRRTVEYWQQLEPAELPEGDEPSLEEQLTEYVLDWSLLAFAEEARRRAFHSEGEGQ